MKSWAPYNFEELEQLRAQGYSLAETSQMTCPHCSGKSMRVYIHDMPDTSKSAEWLWCPVCHRQIHYRIASPHDRYNYSDPINNKKYGNVFSLSGDEWFDFLNTLYEQHILPQIFVPTPERK